MERPVEGRTRYALHVILAGLFALLATQAVAEKCQSNNGPVQCSCAGECQTSTADCRCASATDPGVPFTCKSLDSRKELACRMNCEQSTNDVRCSDPIPAPQKQPPVGCPTLNYAQNCLRESAREVSYEYPLHGFFHDRAWPGVATEMPVPLWSGGIGILTPILKPSRRPGGDEPECGGTGDVFEQPELLAPGVQVCGWHPLHEVLVHSVLLDSDPLGSEVECRCSQAILPGLRKGSVFYPLSPAVVQTGEAEGVPLQQRGCQLEPWCPHRQLLAFPISTASDEFSKLLSWPTG